MEEAERRHQKAESYLRLAAKTDDAELRQLLELLAQAWMEAAEHAAELRRHVQTPR
jgi:hypothetical protein